MLKTSVSLYVLEWITGLSLLTIIRRLHHREFILQTPVVCRLVAREA